MSRNYNRRPTLSQRRKQRQRNEALGQATRTVLMLTGALVSLACVISFGVALGYALAGGLV